MKIIKRLLYAFILGDLFNSNQYAELKDIYNTYIFGRPLRTMIKSGDKVLELGCGKNSLLVRSGIIKQLKVVGVDIFKPYIDLHKAGGLYQSCILADITKIDFDNDEYDIVVCMDVIEHLPKEEGHKLLDKIKCWARKAIITTPNGYVPGIPSEDNNYYQSHQSGWSKEDFEAHGYIVRGASGWKPLRKPDSQLRHIHPFIFWAGLSLVSSFITYFIPKAAFHLRATYER